MATDIKMYWDVSSLQGDFNITENVGDIDTDEGLDTAILISLFTDRRINEDDPILDSNNDNKRGWWGDVVSNTEDDQIGSRLWLLDRSKAVDEVLVQCKEYVLESLQWLIDDGIAKNINVVVERYRINFEDRLYILAEVTKNDGEVISKKYEYLWYNQSISIPSYLPSKKYSIERILNGDFFLKTGYFFDNWYWLESIQKIPPVSLSSYDSVIYNDKLYICGENGILKEWNNTSNWITKATLVGYITYCITVFNNEIYACDGSGSLYKWNGVGDWIQVSYLYIYKHISDLIEYNNKLYGCGEDGILYEFNFNINMWETKTTSIGIYIYSLCVYNNKLYGCGENGILYEWNGTNLWIVKSSFIGITFYSLCVYNNKLYGCTNTGILYEWNDLDDWIIKGSSGSSIYSLCVYNNKLYGCGALGILYEYDNISNWIIRSTPFYHPIYSLIVYYDKLYGTGSLGFLHEWNSIGIPGYTLDTTNESCNFLLEDTTEQNGNSIQIYQNILTIGIIYKYWIRIEDSIVGSIYAHDGIGGTYISSFNTVGVTSGTFIATTTNFIIGSYESICNITIKNISIKEVL